MLRIVLRVTGLVLTGLIVLLIGIGVVWALFPRSVPLAVQYLSGVHTLRPAIAENVSFDWRLWSTGDPKWTALLRRRFPMGSSADDLEKVLRDQDFKIDEDAKSADYDWSWFPCDETLKVEWKTDASGHITWIIGRYRSTCL